jgi:hypothetical protein
MESLINFAFINGVRRKISPDPGMLGEHSYLLELLLRNSLFNALRLSHRMRSTRLSQRVDKACPGRRNGRGEGGAEYRRVYDKDEEKEGLWGEDPASVDTVE